jgi:predicted DNA-binding antitoxin AbrB/MazE fold protein
MKPIHAIYENGVFRPTEPVDLPEHTEVEVEVLPSESTVNKASLRRIYAIMAEEYESGEFDVAERHNEHQP